MLPNVQPIAKLIILTGIIFVIIGVVLYFLKEIPFLGRLPGDIHVERKNLSFHFPVVTCILVSVVLSLLFYLISKK